MDRPMASWEEGVVDLARKLHPDVDIADAGTRTDYYFLKTTAEPERSAMHDAMKQPGLYRTLNAVDGSFDAFQDMLDAGDEAFICSTPSLENPTCASDKLAWLDQRGGRQVTERSVLTFDKTIILGDALVDDKHEIHGAHTPTWEHVVYDSAYNQNTPGPRLRNWQTWRNQIDPIRRTPRNDFRSREQRPFTVVWDMDEPIVHWYDDIIRKTRADNPGIRIRPKEEHLRWELPSFLEPDELEAITRTMNTPGVYKDLTEVEGTRQAFFEMLDEGIEVFIGTASALDNPTCASDKLIWLNDNWGSDAAHRAVILQDKTILDADVLIDDKPKITGRFQPVWTHVVWDDPYNQQSPGPRMTDPRNWREIVYPLREKWEWERKQAA
ncbi:hypothetical protein ACFVAJ_19265 [Agromyces sp. NPDC057679]|uniref:5' nucleotidase, NT5C type n=1 Tax=Agromyces sp. NPDC057679 TaxID=3346207 RepID=UPI00366A5D0A